MNTRAAEEWTVEAEAWEAIGAYLKRSEVRLLSREQQADFRATWAEIAAQEASLDDAILIGLIGGTGVGKSTVINALAGEVVSRSGDRRPTTSRVVCYRHRSTELPDDVPLEDLAQPEVLHRRDALSKVILFDFPDFDSAETSHAEILKRYLPHLDVLFVVVDDMKYADSALYQLLRQLDHDAKNLFTLFNKIDKLELRYPGRTAEVEQDLQLDFRRKLAEHAHIDVEPTRQFAIAARPVLESRLHPDATEPASPLIREMMQRFSDLEDVVEQYQQEKHRRAAKERNLDARKSRLASDLRQAAIGPENAAIIRESQALVETWRNELTKSTLSISTEVFSDEMRRGVRRARLRRDGSAWGIPVSLVMTLLTETLIRGRTEGARQPAELAARFHAHYQPFFQSLENLKHRIAAEFAGSQIAPLVEDEPSQYRSESITLEAAHDFQREMEQNSSKPSRVAKWSAHLPPLLVLALAIWSRFYPVLASVSGESEKGVVRSVIGSVITSLSPTFLIGTLVAVVLAYLFTGFWCWLRVIHQTDAEILAGEALVRERVAQFGEQTLSQLDAEVHALHEEFTQLNALLVEGAPPALSRT
ncbi:MAG: GTPase [Planctomycetota bacterium]